MASIKVNTSEIHKLRSDFDKAKAKVADLSPVMENIAEELRLLADDSFEDEKSPRGEAWKPLSDATKGIRMTRRTGKTASELILKDHGMLRRSIIAKADKRMASIGVSGPASKYAGVQQFGNPNNRLHGKRAPIPARPFLPLDSAGNPDLPKQFEERMLDMIADYILEDLEP